MTAEIASARLSGDAGGTSQPLTRSWTNSGDPSDSRRDNRPGEGEGFQQSIREILLPRGKDHEVGRPQEVRHRGVMTQVRHVASSPLAAAWFRNDASQAVPLEPVSHSRTRSRAQQFDQGRRSARPAPSAGPCVPGRARRSDSRRHRVGERPRRAAKRAGALNLLGINAVRAIGNLGRGEPAPPAALDPVRGSSDHSAQRQARRDLTDNRASDVSSPWSEVTCGTPLHRESQSPMT